MHTPTYAGLHERNDEYLSGLHEAIVSHENFDQVMALRQTKVGPDQFAKMATGNSEFFLTGVVRCGVCGGAVVGTAANSKGRHYRYYDCSMKTKRADAERCRNDRVDADALESTVVSQLIDAYRDSDLFPAAVRLAVRQSPGHLAELDEQVAATSAAVAHSTSALDRYYAALESGELLASDVRGRPLNPWNANSRRSGASWRASSTNAKRRLVGALVESVVVNSGRHVQVTLRVPTVGDAGPAEVLPGGRVRRQRAATRRLTGHEVGVGTVTAKSDDTSPLVRGEPTGQWTPFRMGSQMVALLAIDCVALQVARRNCSSRPADRNLATNI